MNKEKLKKQMIDQGIDASVNEYIQKREKQINRYWLSLWFFTAIIFIIAYCIENQQHQKQQEQQEQQYQQKEEQIKAFFQAEVDSIQYFVDTTLNIEAHVLHKTNKK